MIIAIRTGDLSPDTLEGLERAHSLGFSHIEVNLQTNEFDYGYRRKPNVRFYRELKKRIDLLDLSVWSVAAPALMQEQMFSTTVRKEILMGGAGAAGIIGSKVYVVEPAHLFTSEDAFQAYVQDQKAPPVSDGYDETWARVVNWRMTLALANRDYWLGRPLTNQPERLTKITEHLAIGCALDLRRALYRSTLPDWLGRIGDRLAVAYVYDQSDDQQRIAPQSKEWDDLLPTLSGTRLKCLVMKTGRDQSDQEIIESRDMLQEIISPKKI